MSINSEFSPFFQYFAYLSEAKESREEIEEETLLDAKEELKRFAVPTSSFSFKTFAANVGDSFLAPKIGLNSDLSSQTFALSSNEVICRRTGYEGQNVKEQTACFKECVHEWLNPLYKGPTKPDLARKVLWEIAGELEDFQEMCLAFDSAEPKDIRLKIASALEKKQRCIIPLCTHPGAESDGHVFSCVIELENGRLTAAILNVGAGSELHPILSIDTHVKHSFMFPPIIFDHKNFFEEKPEVAEHFIGLLCSYARQKPEDKKGYNITEIYRLFQGLGKVSSEKLPEGAASLSQRGGTCPAEANKSILRYKFLKHYNLDDYKKFIFFFKFHLYFKKYCQLKHNPESFTVNDRALLRRSLSQFAALIAKHERSKIIDEKALLSAQALLELIEEGLPEEKVSQEETPDFTTMGIVEFPLEIKSQKGIESQDKDILESFSPDTFTIATPKAKDLLTYLNTILEKCVINAHTNEHYRKWRGKDQNEVKAIAIMEALKALPVPKRHGEDAYWDSIKDQERFLIMTKIYELSCAVCFSESQQCQSYARSSHLFMTHLTVLAILDRLASQNPQMGLGGTAYPFYLDAINRTHYFLKASEQVRVRELQDYFKKQRDDRTLFDIRPDYGSTIFLSDKDAACNDHKEHITGLGSHLAYLDGFFDEHFPKKAHLYFLLMRGKTLPDEADMDPHLKNAFLKYSQAIPDEYYLLQHSVLKVMKHLDNIYDGKGINSPQYDERDYKSYGEPFLVKGKASEASIALWKKDSRTTEYCVCDGSFVLADSLQNIYQRAINDSLPRENRAIVQAAKPENQFFFSKKIVCPASIHSELVKIFGLDGMRAPLAMKFCEDHPKLIENEEIKFLIQYAFLNGTALMEQIKNEPTFSTTLREFFDRMIESAKWNNESVLFWIQTAVLVETHITDQIPTQRVKTLLNHECLNAKGQADVYLTKALVAGLNNKWDRERAETFLESTLLYHVYSHGAGIDFKLKFLMKACFLQHMTEIKEVLEKSGVPIVQKLLKSFGIDSSLQENSLSNNWPMLSFKNKSGDEILLNFPYLFVNEGIIEDGDWPYELSGNAVVKTLLQGQTPPVFKVGKNRVVAKDGSFDIALSDGVLVFKKRFKDVELLYVDKSRLETEIPLKEECTFWQCPETKIIWMQSNKDQVFVGCIHEGRVQKTDPEGQPIPNQFLAKLPKDSPLAAYFSLIESPNALCAWGSKEGSIDYLQIPGLNLSFHIQNGKCIYEKNSEYAATTSNQIENPLSTALYLQKADGKIGMILPCEIIHTEAFGVLARNRVESKIAAEHFFYEFDVKKGNWRSSSQLAMLYLIYALKCHGRHEEAAEFLSSFHPTRAFDETEVALLDEILKENHEVRSLSIAVKAFLAYMKAEKIGRLCALDTEAKTPKKELCLPNLERLVELMGDDLEANRLSYSPSVIELLSIDKALEKMLPINFSNPAHLGRFVNRYRKDPQTVFNKESTSHETLKKMAQTIFPIKNIWVYLSKEKSASNATLSMSQLVESNSKEIHEIVRHYLEIAGSSELTESQQEILDLDLLILFERFGGNQWIEGNLCAALFFVFYLPDHFRKIAQKKGVTTEALKEFLMSKEVQDIAKHILSMEIPTNTSVIQTPLKLKAAAANNGLKLHINASAWKLLKKKYAGPLKNLYLEHFNSSKEQIFSKSEQFALKVALSELAKAFDESAKTYTLHTLKGESDALVFSLKEAVLDSENEMKTIKEKIEKILQFPSSKEEQKAVLQHLNSIRQGRIQAPSFQKHVLPLCFTHNLEPLHTSNPFLTEEQISTLYDLSIQYMLAASRIDQAKEALMHSKDALLQKAGAVLSKKRLYNPYRYPEMLVYEYATGNMLRNEPDQARLLKKIIKTLFSEKTPKRQDKLNRLFFEFQAGGGKTKVLSVILAVRAMREGKTPVFFSLPSLVHIFKEDLREAFSQIFSKGVIPLTLPLDKNFKKEDLRTLLELVKTKEACIVTEPESWHALWLGLQDALLDEKKEQPLFQEIMDYFLEHALFFIDEEHRNTSSLIEANNARGEPQHYPSYARELISATYDLLTGWNLDPIILNNGEYLHKALDLAGNKQAAVSEEILKEILQKTAERLVSVLKIPKEHEKAVLVYLTSKTADCPEIGDQKKIDLARGLILYILPFVFSQKDMMDYGPSLNPNDFVFDPYILSEPAGPKFEDPDVAAALTVQGTRQHGLDEHQMKAYLNLMITKFMKVQELGTTKTARFIEDFYQLNPPKEYPLEKLNVKSLENSSVVRSYTKALGENPEVIKTFEKEIALKKIKIYPHKLTSSSQELSVAASAVVHTSATLGVREENPYLEPTGLFLPTHDFMADVIHRALLPHNQEFHTVEESTPMELFESLLEDGTDFSRIDGIINIGGMCRHASSSDWARSFLQFNEKHDLHYAGAIIAKKERVGKGFLNRLYLVMPGEKDILIDGSDVKMVLKKLGLSEKRFFKIYQPDMTTGTDLALLENARMILTIGENVTLAALVQAIMRMRGFLLNPINPDTSQGLIWVCSTKINTMLVKAYGEATPKAVFLLASANQTIQEKEAIKLRAEQDIAMVIRKAVKETKNSQGISSLFLVEMTNDPTTKYGGKTNPVPADQYLRDLADSFAEKGKIDLEQHPKLKQRIKDLIEEVKNKVPFFDASTRHNFNATMVQHQDQEVAATQKVREQQKQLKTPVYFLSAEDEYDYAKKELRIGKETALVLNEERQARRFFNMDWLSENLYLLNNYIHTIESAKAGECMKPPTFILATLNKITNQRDYRLISVRDARIYKKQLQNQESKGDQTAVLFTANGSIFQTDRSVDGLTKDEIEEWRLSDEFRKVIAEVGLISGRQIEEQWQRKLLYNNPERLAALEEILGAQMFYTDDVFQHEWESLKNMLIDDAARSF